VVFPTPWVYPDGFIPAVCASVRQLVKCGPVGMRECATAVFLRFRVSWVGLGL